MQKPEEPTEVSRLTEALKLLDEVASRCEYYHYHYGYEREVDDLLERAGKFLKEQEKRDE